MTLTEFLLARIAEDEASDTLFYDMPFGRTRVEHVEPSRRTLAECEAKRRIIDSREQCQRDLDAAPQEFRVVFDAKLGGLDVALRALASVYADHPDFDPAWAV